MIDKAKIIDGLGGSADLFDIRTFDVLDSTNKYAMALDLCKPWTVIIADKQTAGHGKYHRRFESPEECGIYMSVVVPPEDMLKQLTPLAGVAAANAIKSAVGIDVGIKWVNDLIYRGKKVSGILAEGRFDGGKPQRAVVGIGINVFEPDGGFEKSISNTAGALLEKRKTGSERELIIAGILENMHRLLADYDEKTLAGNYREKSCLTGRRIEFSHLGESVCGLVEGIDDGFSLVVRTDNGNLRTFSAGEVVKIKNFY